MHLRLWSSKYKQTFSNSHVQSRISEVAGLIIGLFVLLFALLPKLTMTMVLILSADTDVNNIHTEECYDIIYLIICVNYIVDPIIYVYCYPPLREAVINTEYYREPNLEGCQ